MASAPLATLLKRLDWHLVRPLRARRPLAAGCSPEGAGSFCLCGREWTFHVSPWRMDAAAVARENALPKARLTEVAASLAEQQHAHPRLVDILRMSQRDTFSQRAGKLSSDPFNLPLEVAELARVVLAVSGSRSLPNRGN